MAWLGFNASVATETLHDLLHHRQTDSGGGGILRVKPVENAKNAVMVTPFDANAIIFNPQTHPCAAFIRTQTNNRRLARLGKLEGIVEQFDHCSLQ